LGTLDLEISYAVSNLWLMGTIICCLIIWSIGKVLWWRINSKSSLLCSNCNYGCIQYDWQTKSRCRFL